MLKALHTNKGILTTKECRECASEESDWWKLTAIVVATKPPDVVQQTLDVVREQLAIKYYFVEYNFNLKELTRLLKGESDIAAVDT